MRVLISFITVLLLGTGPVLADDIALLYNSRPPYLIETGGTVSGLTGTPAGAAFTKAGIPFRWEAAPTNRQLALVKESSGPVCAVGWFKNPEREAFGRFTAPIYQDKATVIMTRGDGGAAKSHRTLETLLADTALKVLVKSGYSYGQLIDDKLAKAAVEKVATTQENLGMVGMILLGRADFMFVAAEEGTELMKSPEAAGKGLVLVELSDVPPGYNRYILCNKNVSQDLIDRLNSAIATLGG